MAQLVLSLGLKEQNAVADTVGRDVIDRHIPRIWKNGILATVVGKPNSGEPRSLNVNEVWREPDAKRLQHLAVEIAKGIFPFPISRRMKLVEIRQAHQMAEKGAAGKVVLTPRPPLVPSGCHEFGRLRESAGRASHQALMLA